MAPKKPLSDDPMAAETQRLLGTLITSSENQEKGLERVEKTLCRLDISHTETRDNVRDLHTRLRMLRWIGGTVIALSGAIAVWWHKP